MRRVNSQPLLLKQIETNMGRYEMHSARLMTEHSTIRTVLLKHPQTVPENAYYSNCKF